MGKTGADDHRLMLLRGGAWVDITEQVGDMQTSDEMNTLSVELTFRLLENPLDRYVPQRRLRVGDKLRIINAADGGAEVFSGMVTADSLEFQYTAHDSGWHLGKSELVFQVSAAAADVALRQLCARAGVPVGNIPAMSTRITAVYTGESFAGILEDILERVTTETGRRFLYRVEGGKFWLRDLPDEVITVQHRPADNVAPFDPTWRSAAGATLGRTSQMRWCWSRRTTTSHMCWRGRRTPRAFSCTGGCKRPFRYPAIYPAARRRLSKVRSKRATGSAGSLPFPRCTETTA